MLYEVITLVTKLSDINANITDLNLWKNTLTVRTEDTTSPDMGMFAMYDSTDDADIQFTASATGGGSLELLNSQNLHLWTGDTVVLPASTTVPA